MGKRWNNKIEVDGFVPIFSFPICFKMGKKSRIHGTKMCILTSVLVNLKSRQQQLDFEMKYACKLQESIFKSSRLKTDNVQE